MILTLTWSLVCLAVNTCAPVSSPLPTSLATTPTQSSPAVTEPPTRVPPVLTSTAIPLPPYPIPSATSTRAPGATPPAPTLTPVPLPSPRPVPPRDAAYDAFARKLKAVIENNDEATLRRLVAPEFSKGRWRAGPGQTRTIDEAIDFIRAVRPVRVSGAYVVDIERPAWNSIEIERQGVRAIVARWQANDGTEEFDHLGVSLVNGEWRWTGLSTALPFYHSPTLSTFRPNALSFFDVMLVGEYRGHNVDGEIKDAQSSPTAFVLKDISGNSIWVAYYEWVLQLPLKPNDRASIGKLVRVLAQAQVGFLHAHWVTLATPADYATATGAIQSISNDPRKLVVQTADGSLHNITFFETTNINDTNDCNVTMTALKNGTRVTVMGRPAPENAVIAEQIYILPATGPDWKVTNHIQVFYDGNLFRRRDLLTNSETTIPNDGKMWNWKCN